MPIGELYIKTARISASADKTGVVTDEKNPFCGYADAFLRYGLSLGDGAIDKMMMEAPAKSAKGTSLATRHGVSYDGGTTGCTDERTLSIDVNILAHYRLEYLKRYRLLCKEVLCKEHGYVVLLRTRHEPDVRYRLLYQTMEQLRQWMSGGIGLLTLVFTEPHPELQWLPQPTGDVVAVVERDTDLHDDPEEYTHGDLAIVTAEWVTYERGNNIIARFETDAWDDSGPIAEDGDVFRDKNSGDLWQYSDEKWRRVIRGKYM